jgi:hypothetical protein
MKRSVPLPPAAVAAPLAAVSAYTFVKVAVPPAPLAAPEAATQEKAMLEVPPAPVAAPPEAVRSAPVPSITRTLTPAPTLTWTLTPVPTATPYPSVSDKVIAWPNPADRSSGRICLAFPADPAAKLHIYDRLAQPVAVLNAQQAPGLACWDLKNSQGDSVAAGQYYVRVLSAGQVYAGKLTLR